MILGLMLMGCTVPFSTSVGSEVEMRVELDRSCEGEGTGEEDGNTTSYTLSLDGEMCTLNVTWAGLFADQEAIDAELEEALEGQPVDRDNITVTAGTLTLERIEVLDEDGASAGITSFPEWSIDLALGDDPIYQAAGTDLPALLTEPVTLPLGPGQVALVNSAVQGTGTVTGSGTAMLRLPISDLPEEPTYMSLAIEGELDLDAEAGL